MSPLAAILIATLTSGLLSVCLAAFLAFRLSPRASHHLVAFAAGVMLSAACLDILPEGLAGFSGAGQDLDAFFMTLLAGLLAFFVLERLALWRHTHTGLPHVASGGTGGAREAAVLILIGDAFHNFVDGVLLAAVFLADPGLGLGTTLAIIAHEIPQELGDFVILLEGGWSRPRALLANGASSLTAVAGGLLGYFFLQSANTAIPYVLTVAGASFLYIAVADLLPMLHRQRESRFLFQSAWLLSGVAVIPGVALALHGAH